MGTGIVQVLLICALAVESAPLGVPDGERLLFYPDGGLASISNFDNGLAEGTWSSFGHDGILTAERHFVAGLQHGTWLSWYRDGGVEQESHFEHGAPVGNWRHYFPNGDLQWETEYVDGEVARRQHFEPVRIERMKGHSELELPGLTLRVDVPNLSTYDELFRHRGEVPLLVDLGHSIPGSTIEVVDTDLTHLELEVWFERALSISAEGPHLDLRDWQHQRSSWVALAAGEQGGYRLPNADAIPWQPVPAYTDEELRAAVNAAGGPGWVDRLDVNKAWRGEGDGSRWSLSRVYLWVTGLDPGGEFVEYQLVLVVPMGC